MKNILKFGLIFSTFFLGNFTFSQNDNLTYTTIDEHAKNLKFPGEISSLVDSLILNLNSDKEKSRAIYSWIAFHIDYDFIGLKDESKLKTDPLGVISNGKSVCQGYANLFTKLAIEAGLESQVIVGWAKNGLKKIGEIDWEDSDHAWNVVKIDDQWQFIDVTWGSGYGKNRKFVRKFNDTYFLTPPEKMILNHYPQEEEWKLGVNITKEDFDNSPIYSTPYITFDIKNLNQRSGILEPRLFKKNEVSFVCETKIKNILITCDNGSAKNIPFSNNDNTIKFQFKVRKKYKIYTIYVNNEATLEYTTVKKK